MESAVIQNNSEQKQGKIYFRTFVLQCAGCIFLVYMASNIGYLQAYQDHPHDKNIYKGVYVALIVYSIICVIGSITGAHINPAISLSMYIDQNRQRKGDAKKTITYIIAQYIGCTVGGLLSYLIQDRAHQIYAKMPDLTLFLKDFLQELIATFIFLTFIYIVVNEDTTFVYEQAWVHLNIAIAFYFCMTCSRLSILNPAVSLGVQLSAYLTLRDIQAQSFLPILGLMIAQFIAGILSQKFFRNVYRSLMVNWKNKMTQEQ